MSSYHNSFNYLNKNSKNDFGWMIIAFDPDNGEMDSYLSQEQIYTDSYRRTKRILYGTRYDTVPTIKISVVKCNFSDFSVEECRSAYRWLTGNPQASWLDLYVGDALQYSFLGTIQDVKPHKLDARTVGFTIYFESISPWAYSPIQTFTSSFDQTLSVDDGVLYNTIDESLLKIDANGVLYNQADSLRLFNDGVVGINDMTELTIYNQTDDLYTPVYLNTVFTNNNSDFLSIVNTTTGEETKITDIRRNEVVVLSSEQFITSDVPNKIFGNSFNFVWPRLVPGTNQLVINGSGRGALEFTYRYPIKIGDCAIDTNIYADDYNCDCLESETGHSGDCSVDSEALQEILNTILR